MNVFEDGSLRESLPSGTSESELTTLVADWNDNTDDLHAGRNEQDPNKVSVALKNLEVLNNRYRTIVAKSYVQALNP